MKKWASIGLAGALAAAGPTAVAFAQEEAVVARLVIESAPQEFAYESTAAQEIELDGLTRDDQTATAMPPPPGETTGKVPGQAPEGDITGTVRAEGESVASAASDAVPAARPDFSSGKGVTAPRRPGIVRTNGEAGKRRFRHPLPVATGAFR
jgi:hypothetical protein